MKFLNCFKKIYLCFFNWCLSPQDQYDNVHKFRVHSLLAVTFITGLLMWSYAFLSHIYINHPSIKYIGFFYAIIHLTAPFLYKATGSIEKSTYIMLIPGGIFQTHYAILTGGFLSPLLIWLAILPVIAGVLTNIKHTVIWTIISCSSFSIIAYLHNYMGYFHTNYLEGAGITITQVITSFGLIFLHSGFTIFLLKLKEISEEQLRAKAIAKQNLLRVIAHDVTNPITIIRNNLTFLNEQMNLDQSEFSPKIKNKLVATEKSSNKIFNLLSSVKEIEAFESGKKELSLEKVSIRECVNECIELLSPMIEAKKIRVRILMDDDYVWGLKSVIEHQIVANILTNSIKFSESGSEILIHSKKVDKEIHLIIKDQGIGIPSFILNKVFDPLATTSRPGVDGEEGTGFGMPIAKKSVGLIGGDIQVTSRTESEYGDDHGTIFKVSFQDCKHNFNQSVSA